MARIFRKKPADPPEVDSPAPPRVEWDLGHLVGLVRDAAPALEARDVVAPLVHARLADHYRDAGLAPPAAEGFDRRAGDLDVEGWRRLALAVATLDDDGVRATLAALAPRVPVEAQVEGGFLGLARDAAPLTVGLVRQNAVRAEEFARHFAARLGVGIAGETDAQSQKRRLAIDYKRLLAEAERAKAAAQEKMERLRKKQEEADQGRRRGKW